MKATITSKGQITLPVRIRRRLGLKPGDVLEFDESAPYLKAHRAFEVETMRAALGRGRARQTQSAEKWLEDLRGPVDLP